MVICSNQFLSQEPGTNEEIKKFARDKGFKGVLMDKVDVNGPKACPVYNFLKVGLKQYSSSEFYDNNIWLPWMPSHGN